MDSCNSGVLKTQSPSPLYPKIWANTEPANDRTDSCMAGDLCECMWMGKFETLQNTPFNSLLIQVVSVSKKEKTKQRPQALNTVEMLRVASSALGMSACYMTYWISLGLIPLALLVLLFGLVFQLYILCTD